MNCPSRRAGTIAATRLFRFTAALSICAAAIPTKAYAQMGVFGAGAQFGTACAFGSCDESFDPRRPPNFSPAEAFAIGLNTYFNDHLFDEDGRTNLRQQLSTFKAMIGNVDPQPAPGGGLSSTFELANQPTYTLSLGGIVLRYAGARVSMTEAVDSTNLGGRFTDGMTTRLSVRSGWSADVQDRGVGDVVHSQTWGKGFIEAHVIGTPICQPTVQCKCLNCEHP